MEPSDPRFSHPYEPYDIQLEFMSSLYDTIQQGNVGIFESPTGTGKSLSLICGALTWLRDHKRHSLEGDINGTAPATSDWLAAAEKVNRRKALLRDREEFEQKLAKLRRDEARSQRRQESDRPTKRVRLGQSADRRNEDDFLLDEYESGEESSKPSNGQTHFSASTRSLLEKLQGTTPATEEDSVMPEEMKVIFCSRTHSQLSQFVNELRRVKLPNSMPAEDTSDSGDGEPVKQLALGSRKNLCINEKVKRLQSTAAINEGCLELQKPGTAKDKRCPYVLSKENVAQTNAFRDRAIANIRDIEDISKLGQELKICPYYASRHAINPSEVLTLPYPLLLQKSAREALGVSVKDNVVVIDEAHNLMDAIADTFSVAIRLEQLKTVTRQVTAYVQRFKNKLKGKNRVYITQLIRLMNSVTDCLERLQRTAQQQDVQLTAAQLMAGKGVDQITPHKLMQYIHQSKLAYKIEGYNELQGAQVASATDRGLLMLFQSFLVALMNPDAEGRFFASREDSDMSLRYTLLDPREHFRDIVQEARAVILAGGTMSPMSDYAEHLFSYLPSNKLQTFSFGHVIPKDNIFVRPITSGPSGTALDFTFDKRGLPATVTDLGRLLVQVVAIVPDGVVVFFPSYDYLAKVTKAWQQPNAAALSVMQQLRQHKPVFEESKGIATDTLLGNYTEAINSKRGGLLFAVINGSLSEGINFSDALGRAVLCVGLPFPNAQSGLWKAKIQYIEARKHAQCVKQGSSDAEAKTAAKASGRDFYENVCMRAVNQSIGRAIRHREDYAAVLLVDRRFGTERIKKKLPGWIQESLPVNKVEANWQSTAGELKSFFAR
ncbi:ATP-dependent RNA helicase chl1 [Cyphellophora attinorum]|uniref:ATP-dependent DNA helicase CHL1 n=1 Tax=Cyphellophora attinorum TaxID=1664694 RepID=A0A0N0NI12_9EURO|nr:ATP-dependent RNA helicase chl1 [Phialophora attinorum]KPI35188.1 ATP-dependent RNA helicase chl1 [Phialophora attinorum]